MKLKNLAKTLRFGVGPLGREREKAAKRKRREAKFRDDGIWLHEGDIVQRKYASYQAYVEHQASKLDGIRSRLDDTIEEDYQDFVRRFRDCAVLNEAANVLCLGARLGTEVRALHALGVFSVGIDLNPGSDNRHVLPGDFHAVAFPDRSVHAIYTNAMDHVFTIEQFMGEVRRLLVPGGHFVVDMVDGYAEGFTPGDFEATAWRDKTVLLERIAACGGLTEVEVRDLGLLRNERWMQAVFQLPLDDSGSASREVASAARPNA
ncbi:class I SAM-dependent methyltransferase [Algihabitans sp.]|uniref:class I SAM-dependent methyltransferase n=1 Tax=Algihabitans sp. TaxID=2821514 RepID=UPI003BADBAEB